MAADPLREPGRERRRPRGGADAAPHGQPRAGDAGPFLALLADDVVFTTAHQGRWRGVKRGRAEAAALLAWYRDDLRFRGRVVSGPVTANAGTAGFEHRLVGRAGAAGVALDDPRALFLDVRDGRVVAFRDYHGASYESTESFRGTPQERLFSPPPR